MKQQLLAIIRECESILSWGDSYSYHWFWGISSLPPFKRLGGISIAAKLSAYNDNSIRGMQDEVEQFRSRPLIIRFLIRLINYKGLVEKCIMVDYFSVRKIIGSFKYDLENAMAQSRASLNWNNIKEKIGTLKQEVNFGLDKLKNLIQKVETSHSSQASSKIEEGIIADDPNQNKIFVIHEEKQIQALRKIGINKVLQDSYSENEVKNAWFNAIKQAHSDKGGTDKLFISIYPVKEILLNKSTGDNSDTISHSNGWPEFYYIKQSELFDNMMKSSSSLLENLFATLQIEHSTFSANLRSANDLKKMEEILDTFKAACKSIILTEYAKKRMDYYRIYQSKMLDLKKSIKGKDYFDVQIQSLEDKQEEQDINEKCGELLFFWLECGLDTYEFRLKQISNAAKFAQNTQSLNASLARQTVALKEMGEDLDKIFRQYEKDRTRLEREQVKLEDMNRKLSKKCNQQDSVNNQIINEISDIENRINKTMEILQAKFPQELNSNQTLEVSSHTSEIHSQHDTHSCPMDTADADPASTSIPISPSVCRIGLFVNNNLNKSQLSIEEKNNYGTKM